VVRANSANKEYIGLQLATDNSSAVTFQNCRADLRDPARQRDLAGGAGLAESHLQQIISLSRCLRARLRTAS
jgi:hypothetical protein